MHVSTATNISVMTGWFISENCENWIVQNKSLGQNS